MFRTEAGQTASVDKEGRRLADLQRGQILDVLREHGLDLGRFHVLPGAFHVQAGPSGCFEGDADVGRRVVGPLGLCGQQRLEHRGIESLLARSLDPATGRSVLHGRRTTALTWELEKVAVRVGRVARWWDPTYYSTYPDQPGEAEGFRSVQAEVSRALATPADFRDVPPGTPDYALKTGGRSRDRATNPRPAFVVEDGNYVSARWPGDVHTFAAAFARRLPPAGPKP